MKKSKSRDRHRIDASVDLMGLIDALRQDPGDNVTRAVLRDAMTDVRMPFVQARALPTWLASMWRKTVPVQARKNLVSGHRLNVRNEIWRWFDKRFAPMGWAGSQGLMWFHDMECWAISSDFPPDHDAHVIDGWLKLMPCVPIAIRLGEALPARDERFRRTVILIPPV